ncbi:hypothetical protein ODZ84_22770 [Chryseobacterium fluminis]|uniref:hypothetical protein n=1 Tax=Chryseobacterium fluminis TaxID=2983606 RepID=UPI0022531F7F|nr:hypothetical protein [Chryseobacterium sp. MMS21-Ot14]UZT97954.1 hypothetical protein ODZ84_22770 [Chryseobacterium sp. MMS21-Ot14]
MKIIPHKLKGTAGSEKLFKLSQCALKLDKMTENEMDFDSIDNEIYPGIKIGLEIVKI